MNENSKIQGGFFAIPKSLFSDREYTGLSIFARLLYGLMLDRNRLSEQNGWVDEEGKTYFIYTINEICSVLGCGSDKAVKTVNELCDRGLIEKKKTGLGKPARFYINGGKVYDFSELSDSENQNSRVLKNRSQDFGKSESNNNKNNNTEFNNNNLFTPSEEDVKENIDYDVLIMTEDKSDVDAVVDIMCDTFRSSKKKIYIGSELVPSVLVRERLMSVNAEHVSYVLESLYTTKNPIRDIRAYLLKLLYYAPITMNIYYTAKYHCDVNRTAV